MSHCSVFDWSYFSETKHGPRTHASCSHKSSRAPKNFMLHPHLLPKSSIPQFRLRSGKRLKTDRATDETHIKFKHFSNSKNSTLNADEVIESCFARPADSKRYNGMDHVDKNFLSISSALALPSET